MFSLPKCILLACHPYYTPLLTPRKTQDHETLKVFLSVCLISSFTFLKGRWYIKSTLSQDPGYMDSNLGTTVDLLHEIEQVT